MRFCERCGRELPDGVNTCPECGRPQDRDPLIITDKRNGRGWTIMIITMVIAAIGTFLITYHFRFYFMFFFLPIFFFARTSGERTVLDYVLRGGFIGLFIGYIVGMFMRFILMM